MKNQITLSSAIDGYLLHARARRLSPYTIRDYTTTFRKFADFLAHDPPLAAITPGQVRRFLASQNGISKKTLLNYHTGLSALWTWSLAEGLVDHHILRHVDRPRPEQTAIMPYTRADIEAMLNACDHSRSYTRPGQREFSHSRPTALRDRLIIIILLDTGLRATEIVTLVDDQIDLKNQRLLVNGKGAKQRTVRFSTRTAQLLWRYLSQRPVPRANTRRVFLSNAGRPLSRHALRRLIHRLGERAAVPNAHPHRFRHTFAVQFLRNGGNAYTLQALLGHSTMEMVRTYLQLAQQDLDDSHDRASPVDNWNL